MGFSCAESVVHTNGVARRAVNPSSRIMCDERLLLRHADTSAPTWRLSVGVVSAFTPFVALPPRPAVGTVGDAYDNAPAESVIGLYKTEVIRRCGP